MAKESLLVNPELYNKIAQFLDSNSLSLDVLSNRILATEASIYTDEELEHSTPPSAIEAMDVEVVRMLHILIGLETVITTSVGNKEKIMKVGGMYKEFKEQIPQNIRMLYDDVFARIETEINRYSKF